MKSAGNEWKKVRPPGEEIEKASDCNASHVWRAKQRPRGQGHNRKPQIHANM